MLTAEIIYEGDLRSKARHVRSGSTIEVDAPIDNNGKGERFSSTDLVATALGSCMLTVMGIKAKNMEIVLDGTRVDIMKIMGDDPRRIIGIVADVYFPPDLNLNDKQKIILERTANTCPVFQSLHPAIEKRVKFYWQS